MKTPFYSIRTGILANLTFLIISAMLLINALVIKIIEKDLIQARIKTGNTLIKSIGQTIDSKLANKSWDVIQTDTLFHRYLSDLIKTGGFSEIILTDKNGIEKLVMGAKTDLIPLAKTLSRQAAITKRFSFSYSQSTWGVIWLAPKILIVSAPLTYRGETLGGISICSDLTDIYRALRSSEKIILLYIFLNTVILLAFGLYLLSRTIVKPIRRLLKITEKFQEGEDITFPVENTKNEMGQLSRSLNMMLKKLEDNKKELQAHIESLEKANEEIKKTQEEIIRSEKLASVGRLAMGIAHEIGNPIGIVLGYLELLKQEDVSQEEKMDFLERSEAEITRINGIIRQLLDFSRPSKAQKEKIHIHSLIDDTLMMLEHQPVMADIELKAEFKAEKDLVLADPNHLKQVFLNVLLNAADAIEEKIKNPGHTGSGTIEIHTTNKGETIYIEFRDNGCGIDEKHLPHIFDPFYTTKDPGKGTGLGLSVSYKLIQGLGGTILAKSIQGEGTHIIITLPLYSE